MTSKLLFRLLPVQILLAAVGTINGIVSSLFASNSVGLEAMSAVGLYNPVNQIVIAMSMLLVGGASIQCGKYLGGNEMEKMRNTYSLSILIALVCSALVTLILLFIGIFDLSGFLTTDPAIRTLLNQYLIGQAIGVIPYVTGGLFSSFLLLENRSRLARISSNVYILANILLNYLLVHVLRLQALGLALASSLGLWIFCIMQAQFFFSGKSIFRFSWKGLQWRDSGRMIRTGFPGAANTGYQAVRGLAVNMLIAKYVGAAGLSAFTAANTLLGLFWAIPAGMLCVSRMLISISVGEEDRQTLTDTMRNAVFRFTPLMCAVSALLIILARPMTGLYYHDPNAPVYNMTLWGFRLLPLCMPLAVIRMHSSCYSQTIGRTLMVNVLEALDGCVFVCLLTALMIPSIGMNSVYLANIMNGILSILYLIGYAVMKIRRIPGKMEEFMVIPPDFGVPEEKRIDCTVRTMDDVISISEAVQRFCLEQGIDRRRAFFAGLSMEEMAGNVVAHGFHKDKKKHSAEIRVVHKDGDMLLRIKDDCVPFDPAELNRIFNPEDITRNIGIRMVYGIADEIDYQNILGLNVLTIHI